MPRCSAAWTGRPPPHGELARRGTASRRALCGALIALSSAGIGCDRASAPPPLFLLLTVDTLRADRLGAYGSDLALTPRIDALAAESTLFESAYAPASFTLPSIAAVMTGRYPESLGISRNESGVPAGVSTLALTLRAAGWRTAAVVSNFVLRESTGIGAGFDLFDDTFPQKEIARKWPERAAPDTTDAALASLDGCAIGARCFLWVHYQDPHGPYTPPPELHDAALAREAGREDAARELPLRPDQTGMGGLPRYQAIGSRRDVGYYRAGYHAEIQYTDREIGRLLDGIAARGLLDGALIAFLADHGEGLGEDDYWFAHGEYLTDPLVRVPLLVRRPGVAGTRRSDVVSLVDLVPTLLPLLGLEAALEGPGRDLLADAAEQSGSVPYLAALEASTRRRFALVEGDYKLVLVEDGGRMRSQLFRRGHEDVDLSGAAPDLARSLLERLREQRQRIGKRRPETPQELTPEDVEHLRALGYENTR